MRRLFAYMAVVCFAWFSIGCERCSVGSRAVLAAKQGSADRDFASDRDKWHVAETGDRFHAGDSLKTAPAGSAKLTLDDGSVFDLGEDTLVRFLDREPGSRDSALDLLKGKGTLEVPARGGVLRTSLGTVRVEGGSRLLLERVQQSLSFHVTSGAAHVESGEGSIFDVQAGEKVLLSDGAVKLELAEGRRAAELPPSSSELGLPAGEVDLVVGSHVVVHVPEPPTKVRFLFGALCEDAVIRIVGRPEVRGRRASVESLAAGSYPYAVHCVEASGQEGTAVQSGTVTVLQDDATRPASLAPPSTLIEVNGREYTIPYQSQLPQVTFRWSHAPEGATDIKLVLASGGRTRTLATTSPSYGFSSGELTEGTYQVYFTGGGKISPRSVVAIAFDAAGPVANIIAPLSGSAAPGANITLDGVTLPGWSVSLEGQPLGQDAAGRFAVTQTMPEGGAPLVIDLNHSSHGRHVYLRRSNAARK